MEKIVLVCIEAENWAFLSLGTINLVILLGKKRQWFENRLFCWTLPNNSHAATNGTSSSSSSSSSRGKSSSSSSNAATTAAASAVSAAAK